VLIKKRKKMTHLIKFTPDFRDFMAKCLAEDPKDRPTARELLQHPFIMNITQTEEECEKQLSNYLKVSIKVEDENPHMSILTALPFSRNSIVVGKPSQDAWVHQILQDEMKKIFCNFVDNIFKPLQSQNSKLTQLIGQLTQQNAILRQEYTKLSEEYQLLLKKKKS